MLYRRIYRGVCALGPQLSPNISYKNRCGKAPTKVYFFTFAPRENIYIILERERERVEFNIKDVSYRVCVFCLYVSKKKRKKIKRKEIFLSTCAILCNCLNCLLRCLHKDEEYIYIKEAKETLFTSANIEFPPVGFARVFRPQKVYIGFIDCARTGDLIELSPSRVET